MEIDPRLAGPPAGSKGSSLVTRVAGTGSVGVSPAATISTPPTHQFVPGRPLGFPPAPYLTPIQSAPPVFPTPSPASATSQGPPSLASALLDQKRPRACESCRGLKVRCEPNEQNPFATCKRCAKANRECIFTAPSRKRQKKGDSKVAELEKKIDALTASLRAQQARAARAAEDDYEEDDDYLDDNDMPVPNDALKPDAPELSPMSRPVKRPRGEGTQAEGRGPVPKGSKIPTTSHLRPAYEDLERYVYIDVVDRKILSMETATTIFNHYVEDMIPHFPAVVFPAGTTAEDIRQKKPTLFLAILAAASGISDPVLHKTLYKEISRTFAERIMINGEKSLELVQALILCTMWYFVPDHYEELKFYMYIHQAAVMALDIGITRKKKIIRGSVRGLPPVPTQPRPSMGPGGGNGHEEGGRQQRGPPGPNDIWDKSSLPYPFLPPAPPMLRISFPDSDAIESRRTLLACYWTCCNVSMAQRRPNLLRYTKFMDECLEVLENSPEAAPTDRNLCEWIKLQKIAEEVGIGFAFDDPNANVSIDDERIQFSLKGFARQLEEWKSKCPKEAWQESLGLAYNVIMIYAHEIALHRDHNVDDFQPPYTESMMREPSIRPNDHLSSCHINAISRCLSSAHKVLETFTSMSIKSIRSVPVFTFVRTSYACVILIKLYFSASHPQSELGKVIDKNSLKVDEHMDKLVSTLRTVADGESCRQAQRFTILLSLMKQWYTKQKAEIEKGLNAAPEPTDSFKRLGLVETNHPSTAGPMEGMETPRSIDDVSSARTPEFDHFHDSMRPPPRSASVSSATPLHMLSNAALGSSRSSGQQYANIPSPTSSMGMMTPHPAPQAPYVGRWEHGIFPMTQGDGLGAPGMADGGAHPGHVSSGGAGYDGIGDQEEVGESSVDGGTGAVGYNEGVDILPQYVFTGNGEMFMDDTFWAMMNGPMGIFDAGGKF